MMSSPNPDVFLFWKTARPIVNSRSICIQSLLSGPGWGADCWCKYRTTPSLGRGRGWAQNKRKHRTLAGTQSTRLVLNKWQQTGLKNGSDRLVSERECWDKSNMTSVNSQRSAHVPLRPNYSLWNSNHALGASEMDRLHTTHSWACGDDVGCEKRLEPRRNNATNKKLLLKAF